MAKNQVRTIARSAKTGKFVTQDYAKKNPNTTVVEKVPTKKGK